MKASRKLIPAFAMLLIAAVMMSTATFAWFVTNGTVTASGMTVTAKANNTYLQIAAVGSTFDSNIDNNRVETVSITGEKYPVVYKDGTEGIGWYTAIGSSFTDGTANGGSYSKLPAITANYVVEQKFQIKVAENYDDAVNFILSSITVSSTKSSQAASVVVVGPDGTNYTTVANSGGEHVVVKQEDKNIIDRVSTTAQEITVYVYINGDHPDVTNEKLLADYLDGLMVTLTFDAGTAAIGS